MWGSKAGVAEKKLMEYLKYAAVHGMKADRTVGARITTDVMDA